MNWIAEDNSESDSWYRVSEVANNFNSLGSKQIKSCSKPKFVSNGSARTPKRQAYSSIAEQAQIQKKLTPIFRASSNNVAKQDKNEGSLKNGLKID